MKACRESRAAPSASCPPPRAVRLGRASDIFRGRVPRTPARLTRTPFGLFLDPHFRRQGRWIASSALIGAVSGAGAIGFDLCFRIAQRLLLEGIGRFQPPASGLEGGAGHPPEILWLLPVSLVIGGLITGALVYGFAPEAEGHGTDAVIKAFHHLGGRIRRRVPIVKAVASAITNGSGRSRRSGPASGRSWATR